MLKETTGVFHFDLRMCYSCVLVANACLRRDWRPLSSGVVWERENVIFMFNRGESPSWYCSSCFVVIFFLHVFLHCSNFFNDLVDLLYFVHPGIFLFHRRLYSCVSFQNWETAFTSPIFPRNHSSSSKAFFRARYSFILWACFEDTVNTNQDICC